MDSTIGIWLDTTLVLRIFFLGAIGMPIFLIFVSELKWGAPGLNSILAGIETILHILRGKHHQRDASLQRATRLGSMFVRNVITMTLVGLASAALATVLLVLAFRFGYLVDTTCWFDKCG